MSPSTPPHTYEVVRETWLTRRPSANAFSVASISTLVLALGSLVYLADLGGLGDLMSASYASAVEGRQYWRLWTTVFAHADLGHLVSNTLLFFILGFFLNGYFGRRLFPILALAFGGITNYIVLRTYPPDLDLVGASGVVYWMGGLWLVLYFALSRQKNLQQRLLRSLGVAILIFMPAEKFEPNISYRTHFIGFALGAAVGLLYFYAYRERFRAAEVRELIVEELDPEDELPPPEGFPIGAPGDSDPKQ